MTELASNTTELTARTTELGPNTTELTAQTMELTPNTAELTARTTELVPNYDGIDGADDVFTSESDGFTPECEGASR
jgi:hypothetical protein